MGSVSSRMPSRSATNCASSMLTVPVNGDGSRTPDDPFRPERIDGNGRAQRRVDAARQPEDDSGKSVLRYVIAQSDDERAVGVLQLFSGGSTSRPA